MNLEKPFLPHPHSTRSRLMFFSTQSDAYVIIDITDRVQDFTLLWVVKRRELILRRARLREMGEQSSQSRRTTSVNDHLEIASSIRLVGWVTLKLLSEYRRIIIGPSCLLLFLRRHVTTPPLCYFVFFKLVSYSSKICWAWDVWVAEQGLLVLWFLPCFYFALIDGTLQVYVYMCVLLTLFLPRRLR